MSDVMIVTGGSRGIGAATARIAGERGYAVCVNYRRDADAAQAVVADIEKAGGRAIAVAGDMSSEPDVINLFGAEWREGSADRGVIVIEVDGGRADDGNYIFDYIGPSPDDEGRIDPAFPLSPESRTQWQLGVQFIF